MIRRSDTPTLRDFATGRVLGFLPIIAAVIGAAATVYGAKKNKAAQKAAEKEAAKQRKHEQEIEKAELEKAKIEATGSVAAATASPLSSLAKSPAVWIGAGVVAVGAVALALKRK